MTALIPSELTASDERVEPVPRRLPRDWTWLNWALTLLTAAVAALVMMFALHAALRAGGCTASGCPDFGPNGSTFRLLFDGAALVGAATVVGSMFTARRLLGVVVPLTGCALLLADVAVLTATFG